MNYKAYVCKTDWDYHFPDDWNGVDIYFSEESIKVHRKCVKECGVEQVRVVSESEYQRQQEELGMLRRTVRSLISGTESFNSPEELVDDLFKSEDD